MSLSLTHYFISHPCFPAPRSDIFGARLFSIDIQYFLSILLAVPACLGFEFFPFQHDSASENTKQYPPLSANRTANNTTAVPYVGPVSVVQDVWMFNLPISLHHLLSPCGHLYTWHPPQPHLHPARGNSALSLTPTPRKHSHHPLLQ